MSNEELCVLAKGGDTEARNQLLENNLSFIQQQANKIWGQSGSGRIDVDDLIQEGCLGLMKAISRFDPERGMKFLTYAVWWIRKFMRETVSIVLADDEVCLNELEDFSSNPDVDTSRSHLNFHIVQPERKYRAEAERQISEAKCRTRKDSVRVVEALMTASPEFFKGKKKTEVRAFFEEAVHFIEKHQSKDTII